MAISHTSSPPAALACPHSAPGYTTPPHAATQCASNCYATLSAQLASLGAAHLNLSGTSGAGAVPLDTLLSLDCAAQTAQTQTLSCDRCMSGANSQTTLLLLAVAAEKLVGLFEAWVEGQGPGLPMLRRESESSCSSSGAEGESAVGGTGRGVSWRGEENAGNMKASLLAGSFAADDEIVKGEFLARLLVLRIDRLGEMVIELERRVEKGSQGRGVGNKVAGEMLHDVGRRIFFLKGKVALPA
jgi:hypothetical protein